jgi:hypothetical protein
MLNEWQWAPRNFSFEGRDAAWRWILPAIPACGSWAFIEEMLSCKLSSDVSAFVVKSVRTLIKNRIPAICGLCAAAIEIRQFHLSRRRQSTSQERNVQMTDIPFGITDWSQVDRTEQQGPRYSLSTERGS